MIRVYKGDEIGVLQIMELKYITENRYDESIYNFYYSQVNDVNDLASKHGVDVDDEILVLGSGWFLCYSISYSAIEDIITFLEWVSLDNPKLKAKQTAEMLAFFKSLFTKYKNGLYIANLRHDSSFRIYSYLKNKKYLLECEHSVFLDCAETENYSSEDSKIIVENFLGNENLFDKDLLKYILHDVEFIVTNKFSEECYKRRRVNNKN